mmetsp:Transcript_33237/g.75721  ORF Transcript_33237/g.75721 Transcript_33237/m.75721 type:complete len:559 (-) Transcript_33237:12-1688(-)
MERMPRWREHHLRGGSAANNWLVYGQPNGEFSLLKLPPIPTHPSKKPPQLPGGRAGAEKHRLSPTRSESPSARYGNELPSLNKEPRAEASGKDDRSVPGTAQRRARSEKPAEKEPPPPTDLAKRNPPLPSKALAMVRTKLVEAARVDALGLAQIESMLSRCVDDAGAFTDEMLRKAIRKGLKVPAMTVSDGEISSMCANLDSEKTGKVTMARLLTFLGPVKFRRKEKFGYQRSYVSPYRQPSPDKLGSGRTSPTEARGTEAAGSATVVAARDAPQEEEALHTNNAAPRRSSRPALGVSSSSRDPPAVREEVVSADELEHDLAASFSFGNTPQEVENFSFDNAPLEVDNKDNKEISPSPPHVDVAEQDDGDSIASDVVPAEDDGPTQPDTARTVDTRLSAPVAAEVVQEKVVVPEEEPNNDEDSYDTESFADESIASEAEEVQSSPVSQAAAGAESRGKLLEKQTEQEEARRPSDVVSPFGSQVVKQPLAPVASSDKVIDTASTQGGTVQSHASPSASQMQFAMQLLEPDAEEEGLAKEEIEEEEGMQDELDELLRIVG